MKIALEDEKYAELESDLKKKHENILELLEKVIKDLQELTGKDRGILYGCNFSKSKSVM